MPVLRAIDKLILFFGIIHLAITSALAADSRPNILFLLADDQRADTVGALGNPHIRTPNLDRLAHSGLAFSHAYIQGALYSRA